MTLSFELVAFTIRDGAEPAVVAERPVMVAALQRAFPGVLAAWLARHDDGSWLDIVLWRSRDEAEDAARRIHEVPEAEHWFRHIAESKVPQHVQVTHEQLLALRHLDNEGRCVGSTELTNVNAGCTRLDRRRV